MEETLARLWQDLVDRPSGPLALRFYLQPTMAIFFAIKDGVKDARRGKPPYLWAILTTPEQRRELIRDGWKSIAKIVSIALLLDFIYQLLVLKHFYPGETMIVVFCLAVLPYALLRGPTNRLMRRRYQASSPSRDKAA